VRETWRGKPAEALFRQDFAIASIVLTADYCSVESTAIECIPQISRCFDLHLDQ
jgi:hypothetical protein